MGRLGSLPVQRSTLSRPPLNLDDFTIVSRSATLFSARCTDSEPHARRCRLQTIQASRAPAQPSHRTATYCCIPDLNGAPIFAGHCSAIAEVWPVDRNSGMSASDHLSQPGPTLSFHPQLRDLFCHNSIQGYELGQGW